MDIFLDTANLKEIEKWLGAGVIDGVTTNPSIMRQDEVTDFRGRARDIAALIGELPVSVEVTSDDFDMMREQAKEFASWAPNIVVKVPQITRQGIPCYGVIRELENSGVRINATAALSMGQLMLSAKSGVTYASLFVGRIADEGGDAATVLSDSIRWLDEWGYDSKVIAGSIRSVGDVILSAKAGAHVITIPPKILDKLADHRYSRATVSQFLDDAEAALKEVQDAKLK